jgi:hypothetical protein
MMNNPQIQKDPKQFFIEIRELIEKSRQELAVTVNSTMTLLYWQIGKRINNEVLKNKRAEYGEKIIFTLSKQLKNEYDSGWSEKQLRHCLRFAEIFPDEEIVSALRRQLSWTHLKPTPNIFLLTPLSPSTFLSKYVKQGERIIYVFKEEIL